MEYDVKISFLVTYYNQEKFVRCSLDSILRLGSGFPYEILVGDDGSSDDTCQIVQEYVDKYPSVRLFRTENGKTDDLPPLNRASLNRLNLLSHAKGQYFMILDGDDYYYENASLDEGFKILDLHPDIVGCAHDFVKEYPGTAKRENPKRVPKYGYLSTEKYIKYHYLPAGVFIFRNVFSEEKIKILEKNRNFDDVVIPIYMSQFGQIFHIKKLLYIYIQTADSMWLGTNDGLKKALKSWEDFEVIKRIAPMFTYPMFLKRFSALKYLFKHRGKVPEELGMDKFVKIENTLKNQFIRDILSWKDLSLKKRIKNTLKFYFFYIKRKFIKLFKL